MLYLWVQSTYQISASCLAYKWHKKQCHLYGSLFLKQPAQANGFNKIVFKKHAFESWDNLPYDLKNLVTKPTLQVFWSFGIYAETHSKSFEIDFVNHNKTSQVQVSKIKLIILSWTDQVYENKVG